jgi:DHA2 family multidrug resistance protein-like MFS transporter
VLTPFLVRYIQPAFVMAGGLVVTAIGCGLVAQAGVESAFASVIIGTVLISMGPAPVYVLAVDMIIGSAPAERSGAASAISETSNEFGGALGVALIGAISTFLYRRMLESDALNGLPANVLEEAKATVGGAIAVSAQLPGADGAALQALARAAFVESMVMTACFAAGLLLVGAVAAALLLRVSPGASPRPN